MYVYSVQDNLVYRHTHTFNKHSDAAYFRNNNYRHVPRCYVIRTLHVCFCFYLVVCARWMRVHNVTSFKQLFDVCYYVVCWRILWHASINLFILMPYCETYSNIFNLIIRQKLCIIFWNWRHINLHCNMQTIRHLLLGI